MCCYALRPEEQRHFARVWVVTLLGGGRQGSRPRASGESSACALGGLALPSGSPALAGSPAAARSPAHPRGCPAAQPCPAAIGSPASAAAASPGSAARVRGGRAAGACGGGVGSGAEAKPAAEARPSGSATAADTCCQSGLAGAASGGGRRAGGVGKGGDAQASAASSRAAGSGAASAAPRGADAHAGTPAGPGPVVPLRAGPAAASPVAAAAAAPLAQGVQPAVQAVAVAQAEAAGPPCAGPGAPGAAAGKRPRIGAGPAAKLARPRPAAGAAGVPGAPACSPAPRPETPTGAALTAAGEAAVGARVAVWWPEDRVFYKGALRSYDAYHKRHKVLYDDSADEWVALARQRFRWLTPRGRSAGALHPPLGACVSARLGMLAHRRCPAAMQRLPRSGCQGPSHLAPSPQALPAQARAPSWPRRCARWARSTSPRPALLRPPCRCRRATSRPLPLLGPLAPAAATTNPLRPGQLGRGAARRVQAPRRASAARRQGPPTRRRRPLVPPSVAPRSAGASPWWPTTRALVRPCCKVAAWRCAGKEDKYSNQF